MGADLPKRDNSVLKLCTIKFSHCAKSSIAKYITVQLYGIGTHTYIHTYLYTYIPFHCYVNSISRTPQGSLKSSSRRRPVSVDYELNSNSWEDKDEDPTPEFPEGGAGGGRASMDADNRSSHYSNRNSHPLTEREMEQGLQNLEGQKGEQQG